MQTLTAAQNALLVCLYRLARADKPASLARLVAVLDRTAADVRADLVALDRAGLVDAARARLTLAGLCVAASARVRRAPGLSQAA